MLKEIEGVAYFFFLDCINKWDYKTDTAANAPEI